MRTQKHEERRGKNNKTTKIYKKAKESGQVAWDEGGGARHEQSGKMEKGCRMKKSHLPDSVWIPLSNLVPPRQSPAHEASPSHGRVFPWVPQNNACGTMPSELVADSPHNERNGNGEKNRKVSSVDAFRKKEERPPPPWALRDGSDTNGIGRRGRGRGGGH